MKGYSTLNEENINISVEEKCTNLMDRFPELQLKSSSLFLAKHSGWLWRYAWKYRMATATDYYQKLSNWRNTRYVLVAKESKFGIWDIRKSRFQIQPEYDYLAWREWQALLSATKNGQSIVIDISGSQLP